MKVLQFIPSINKQDGGTTTYMQQLAPALGSRVSLHVCALTPIEDFVEMEGCELHSITLSLLHIGKMKREWTELLDRIEPDIVHVNCCWMPQIALVSGWTDAWRKRGHKSTQILLTPHGMLEPWIIRRNYWSKKLPAMWLYQKKAVERADLLIATAEEERQHLLELGWNKSIELVQNGIDVEHTEMKKEWKAVKKLLFMSRIHPKKGLDLLFEAINGLDVELVVAGSGETSYVESLKKNAPQNAHFAGAVYGEKKWQMIREADLVVLPSHSENYGLIIAEALASGTPVITTQGTPWETVERNGCGWWVEDKSETLRQAIKEAMRLTESEIEAMGKRAREVAERECSVGRLAQQLTRIYQKLSSDCLK